MRYHGTLAPNAAWRKLIVPRAPEATSTDVLECPRCGGRMKIIATVMEPEAVRRILTCIGLPARPPPVAPARERAELGILG